jgi:hypothetical protein
MLDDKLLRYVVHHRSEFDEQMAAFAATGTGGKIIESKGHRRSVKHAEKPSSREQSFPA